MKVKILTILLILSSLFGYLEWGSNSHEFVFQAEGIIIKSLVTDPQSVMHPFILLPLTGQVLLLASLFFKKGTKWLIYSGLAGIGVLFLMFLLIGIIALKIKILVFTLPFLIVSFFTVRELIRKEIV